MTVNNGDVLRVTVKMSIGAQDVQNVFHYQLSGAGGVADSVFLSNVLAEIETAYDGFKAYISDQVSFDTVQVYNVSQDVYVGEVGFVALSAGTLAGDMNPIQTAGLALFGTDTLGSQGRKFLPPSGEGFNDSDGTPSPGYLTNLATWAANILNGFAIGGDTVTPGNWRDATATFIPWVIAKIQDKWATQRRRYYGSGS